MTCEPVKSKNILKWLMKNWGLCLKVAIMITCILVPTLILLPPGKPTIIASMITFNLNGEIKEDVLAQLQIENQTTSELEDNVEIRRIIEKDLKDLASQIEGLQEILVYNFDNSFNPGSIDLVLENIKYFQKSFLKKINKIIQNDVEKWWYVDGAFFFTPLIEEGESISDAYTNLCGGSITLSFFNHPVDFQGDVTLVHNGSILASMFENDGENWTVNEVFHETLRNEILSLKNTISGIENITMRYVFGYFTYSHLEDYPPCNLSEPILYDVAWIIGQTDLSIQYNEGVSETEQNAVFKVFEQLILSKWFVQSYWVPFCEFSGLEEFVYGVLIALPICTITFFVTFSTILKKKRKKVTI